MGSGDSPITVTHIGRMVFGTATILCGLGGLVFRGDARWFVAAGVFGIIWWTWDLLVEHVFSHFGDWASTLFVSGAGQGPLPNTRPTLDDTIRLLESHLEGRASRQVEINAAIRLEEIYRTVKKDRQKARGVIEEIRGRYPDAPELGHLERDQDE